MPMVGRRRGGGGVQGSDWELLRFSAARMSALEHPCDQHLAQFLPSIHPTETERFLPQWTGHLILRMFPLMVEMEALWRSNEPTDC